VPGLLKSEVGAKKIRALLVLNGKCTHLSFIIIVEIKSELKAYRKTALLIVFFFTYLKTLSISEVSFRTIRSMQSQLYTIFQKNIGFTALSMDRFILSDGINALPYGHSRIRANYVCSVEKLNK